MAQALLHVQKKHKWHTLCRHIFCTLLLLHILFVFPKKFPPFSYSSEGVHCVACLSTMQRSFFCTTGTKWRKIESIRLSPLVVKHRLMCNNLVYGGAVFYKSILLSFLKICMEAHVCTNDEKLLTKLSFFILRKKSWRGSLSFWTRERLPILKYWVKKILFLIYCENHQTKEIKTASQPKHYNFSYLIANNVRIDSTICV